MASAPPASGVARPRTSRRSSGTASRISRDDYGLPILPDPQSARQPRKQRSTYERKLQAAMIDFYSVCAYPGQALLFAVPNGEERDPGVAGMLSGISAAARENLAAISDDEALRPFGQGVLPGAPDLILMTKGPYTVPVEVKEPKSPGRRGGELSKVQQRFAAKALQLGYPIVVITSLEEWADLLEECGIKLRSRPLVGGRL